MPLADSFMPGMRPEMWDEPEEETPEVEEEVEEAPEPTLMQKVLASPEIQKLSMKYRTIK